MDPRFHMVPETRLTWAHWAQALDSWSKDIQDGLGPHRRLGLAPEKKSMGPRPGPAGELFFTVRELYFWNLMKHPRCFH